MALDTNVFDKIKTFADYQKAEQDFQMRKALAQQQLQSGGIDAATKSNIYATQVLSGALAGGQPAYDQAKQGLQQMGIDTSNWAPDVETGAQQAQAARLAQSPLGSLLNAGLKAESNGIAATAAMGSTQGGAQLDPLSASLVGKIAPAFGGQNTPQSSVSPMQSTATPISRPEMQPAQQATAMNELYGDAPAQPVVSQQQPASAKFNPPTQAQGETNQAYNQRIQTAFEAYKADPALLAENKKNDTSAGKQGEAIGDATKTLNIMQSNLPQVLQRFQDMRAAASKAGYGSGYNNEGDGFLQNMQNNFSSETSDANAVLKQRAAQGILPELGPQLAQAGIRGNKFLETIATSASGLDLNAPPSAKLKAIDGLENTYINNLKATAAQLRANGQQAPSDAEIDATASQIKKTSGQSSPAPQTALKNGAIADNPQTGESMVYMDGAWKKLK